MTNYFPVLKNDDNEMPIPEIWRDTFEKIVEALRDGGFRLGGEVVGVRPVSQIDLDAIAKNIANYGCCLVSLSKETWDTSVCLWVDGYWDVLVDLYTKEEGASDLVLAVRVYEEGSLFSFDIQSVYVP